MRHNAAPCRFDTSASWVILSPIERSIKEKIEKIGVPLKEWDISINYGIKTGFNKAFIITEQKRTEILANCANAVERKRTDELIRPILRGRDIKRYSYTWANLYIIATFPALRIDIEMYPAVKRYLLSFGIGRLEQTGRTHIINGERITARKKTCNKWFETQDQIGYWEDFSKPKIVWGEISDKTKFALDQYGKFCNEATTFLMTGKSLQWLVCFLNSSISEYLFSTIGTTTGVGTVRWKKYTIEQLLVPKVLPHEEQFFIQLLKQFKFGKITEADINRHVYALCRLSEEEITFIEHYVASI